MGRPGQVVEALRAATAGPLGGVIRFGDAGAVNGDLLNPYWRSTPDGPWGRYLVTIERPDRATVLASRADGLPITPFRVWVLLVVADALAARFRGRVWEPRIGEDRWRREFPGDWRPVDPPGPGRYDDLAAHYLRRFGGGAPGVLPHQTAAWATTPPEFRHRLPRETWAPRVPEAPSPVIPFAGAFPFVGAPGGAPIDSNRASR
jgi:hypothetical protein